MPDAPVLIAAWARSAVAPRGGALAALQPHELAAPVVQALLERAGITAASVDALVAGNALGAGGNPARMVALAAGLPEHCAAFSIDTQCCSGLDAVSMGVALIRSGQAGVVIAGGVEAWSRAPIRQHRPLHEGERAQTYERPAFSPDPSRDPDMLVSAARYALSQGFTREAQDAYAVSSHARAVAHHSSLAAEIVSVAGLQHDAYPRKLDTARAARMPLAVKPQALHADSQQQPHGPDCGISTVAVSAKADGAAFVLLASAQACERLGLQARAAWVASASVGSAPDTPLLAAEAAALTLLRRCRLEANDVAVIELHDAFAVQGLRFCAALELGASRLNRRGGGLARGHPIGASAAMALVRALADLTRDEARGARGMAVAAAAGGLGAAMLLERL